MPKQVVARISRQLRHRVKTFLGTRPGLYFPIFRNREGYGDLLVSADTDICIEGFPRSANSFATGAFQYAQPESVHIAHHTHVAANAMRACELQIPTVVLIRNPVDAIISNISLAKEVQLVEKGKEPDASNLIGFRRQLTAWCAFYEALCPFQSHFVLAPFEEVVEDMGRVIDRANKRFRKTFAAFEHTEKNAEAVHDQLGYHAGPNKRRKAIKQSTQDEFGRALHASSRLQQHVDQARDLRRSLLTESASQIPGT